MFQCKPCTYLASRLHYLQIDQNELPLETHHLGVPSGASKRISKPMVHLALAVHQPCTDTNSLQMDRNKIPYDPRHLGVPSGASKTISEPMLCSAQTMHLSCVKTDPMGCLAQTVHISCKDTNTVSKQTKTRFHMNHVT